MKTCQQTTKVCSCSKMPINIPITAFLIRLFMIFFGSRILDKSVYDLKYTDIDYNIFTDAAQLVVSGQSPYDRSTYRYPPLLAIIMTPNMFFLPEWGKLIFSLADVGIVYLIYAVKRQCVHVYVHVGVYIYVYMCVYIHMYILYIYI
jgi:hypothetical protein